MSLYSLFNTPFMLWAPEKDKGADGDPGNPTKDGDGETPAGHDTDGDKTGGDGDGNKDGKDKPKIFTQAEVDQIVTDRLKREKEKAEKAQQKAAADAESKALADQQKWQELAQKHEGTIAKLEGQLAELEGHKERADKYEASLKTYLDSSRDGLPDHILALLDKLDVAEQLEYIAANRESLITKKSKVPETPNPADDKELTEAQKGEAGKASGSFYSNLFTG